MAALPRLARLLVVVSLLLPFAMQSGAAGADTVANRQATADRLAAELAALGQRSSQLAEAYDQAMLHQADVANRLAAARSRLGSTTSALTSAQQRVRDYAIESYMQGGAARQLLLLIPSSASEIAVRGTYVASVTSSANDAIDALHQTHADLAREEAALMGAQAAAARAVANVQAAQRAAAAADGQIKAAYATALAQLGQAKLVAAQQAAVAANQARIAAAAAAAPAPTHRTRTGSGGSGLIPESSAPLPPPGIGAQSAIAWARAELGKPYVYGGAGPDDFDCSGLTAWAWGHAGHPLPHSSEEQYYDTTHVPISQLQPGDLVFYGMPPHHVGIYVGSGEMINALHSGTNVEYDSIYIEGDLIGGGRVN